jgi:hypothetical protein
VGFWQDRRDRKRAARTARNELRDYVKANRGAVIDKLTMTVDLGETVSLYLFADRILMIRASRPEQQLVAGARASVEQGEDREIYITIEGPDFAWSLAPEIPPILVEQSNAAARAFVANVNLASRRAGGAP